MKLDQCYMERGAALGRCMDMFPLPSLWECGEPVVRRWSGIELRGGSYELRADERPRVCTGKATILDQKAPTVMPSFSANLEFLLIQTITVVLLLVREDFAVHHSVHIALTNEFEPIFTWTGGPLPCSASAIMDCGPFRS